MNLLRERVIKKKGREERMGKGMKEIIIIIIRLFICLFICLFVYLFIVSRLTLKIAKLELIKAYLTKLFTMYKMNLLKSAIYIYTYIL